MPELLDIVGLDAKARKRKLREYSKGMARRIGLAQALINNPELILLDEPTTGLDPIGTREMKDLILSLKEQGKTVLLCSHLLADVQDVCDRITILFRGRDADAGRGAGPAAGEGHHADRRHGGSPSSRSRSCSSSCAGWAWPTRQITHPTTTLEDLFMRMVGENARVAAHRATGTATAPS